MANRETVWLLASYKYEKNVWSKKNKSKNKISSFQFNQIKLIENTPNVGGLYQIYFLAGKINWAKSFLLLSFFFGQSVSKWYRCDWIGGSFKWSWLHWIKYIVILFAFNYYLSNSLVHSDTSWMDFNV